LCFSLDSVARISMSDAPRAARLGLLALTFFRESHAMMTETETLAQLLLSDDAAHIRQQMERLELPDKATVFRRGDPGDAFYIVESGQVRIFTADAEGRELTLNILKAGDAFGELASVDDRPRSASAVTVGPTVLRRMRRDDFLDALQDSPALSRAIITLLIQRARHMTDYIERLGHWARLVAQGQYVQAMRNIEDTGPVPDRALTAVASAVQQMVHAVQEREETLRRELSQLRIQIDEEKRKQHVAEITETDYFQGLAQKARQLRKKPSEGDVP